MLSSLFHAWERRLASATTDRVVRPFEWGLEWIDGNEPTPAGNPAADLRNWVARALSDTDTFFRVPPSPEFAFSPASDEDGCTGSLRFPSAFQTPHPENNTVHARYFRSTRVPGLRRAVVVLPHWNAGPEGHAGLCRLLARFGLSTLRLSLPYHDVRMPPSLHRADYIVSANVARTVQVCRQAVMDARRAVEWLALQGYERIGILGTSLGSCLAMLTAAHEPRITAQALNHISPFFADVVWEGLSTEHVKAGLDGSIDLEQLRALWLPISPQTYLDRIRGTKTLLIYARYDLSFPVRLSRAFVDEFRRRGVPHDVAVLPCGHYTTGVTPFKYLDGYFICRFLDRNL